MKWRYFGRHAGSGEVFQVYRCPANGRPLASQRPEDVQFIDDKQSWLSGGRAALARDEVTGWFSEQHDELTEEEARAIIESWRRSAHDVLVELLAALVSSDSGARERAADESTFLHRRLSHPDAHALARALVSALLAETTARCQDAQLNALADLNASHDLEPSLLQRIEVLRGTLQPPLSDYLDGLLKP